MEESFETLLAFFKALADANRLKLIGLLAQKESSVEELAAMLEINPSTVSHHLAKLAEIKLVSARAEGYYNIYHLETDNLESMARQLLSKETLPAVAKDLDRKAYDRFNQAASYKQAKIKCYSSISVGTFRIRENLY